MKVYIVRRESGRYSDKLSVVEGAFASYDAAVRFVESKEIRFFKPDDGDDLWESYYGGDDEESEDREAGRIVTRSPTRHPSPLSRERDDPRFDSWYVDNDRTYDNPSWFVEEMEVRS